MALDCPLTDNIFKLPAPAWFDQELFKRLTGFCKAFLKLEAFYPLKKTLTKQATTYETKHKHKDNDMHGIRHKYKLTSEDTVTTAALRESNMADALCLLFGTYRLIGSALVSVGQGLDRAKYFFSSGTRQ